MSKHTIPTVSRETAREVDETKDACQTRDTGFKPSEHQCKVFDYVASGKGNLVLSAVAGSGKTTTILGAVRHIDAGRNVLIIAFNKSIATEIADKASDLSNVTVKTANALGYQLLFHCGLKCSMDNFKYSKYIMRNLSKLVKKVPRDPRQRSMTISRLIKMVDYSRSALCDGVEAIAEVAVRYGIGCNTEMCQAVDKCLAWGRANTETIDFKDQVWLPHAFGLKSEKLTYDWVIIDEAQDLSPAMLDLFKRFMKPGGRFMAVGDEHQSINMWAGAEPDIFNWFRAQPDTEEFTLPVTYRCDRSIVEYANSVFPGTVAREGADKGEILEDKTIGDVRDGDMILCKTNAPLAMAYIQLLQQGKAGYIKGDYGQKLLALLKVSGDALLSRHLDREGVFPSLYATLFDLGEKLAKDNKCSVEDAAAMTEFGEMMEKIECLELLSEGCTTKEDLVGVIDRSFRNDGTGVCLSTVHKAKGLEADRVFICCPSSLYQNKKDCQEWCRRELKNLRYVAYTRPRHVLGFIKEDNKPGCIPLSGTLKSKGDVMKGLRESARKLAAWSDMDLCEWI